MRQLAWAFCVSAALALTCSGASFSQDIENGQRLSERWCSGCHATGTRPAKPNRAPSFATIAARQDVTADEIAAFLLLPHATMPNERLSRQDARDIAAFILKGRNEK